MALASPTCWSNGFQTVPPMARTVAADAAYKCAILLLIIYLSWGVGGEKITPVRRVSVPTSRVRSPIWVSGPGRGHGGCEQGGIGVSALVWVLGPLLLLTRCCLPPRTPWPAHIRPAYTGPSQCPRTHRARCCPFARSPAARPGYRVRDAARKAIGGPSKSYR